MTAGYFVCAVGNGASLISVGSVLQPLSLGFAEPASFAQGSRNKIIYCDKNLLAKSVVTDFCAAYAARCVGGHRTLQVHANKIMQISRADDIRPYEIVLIYNIVWPSIIDIYTDSPSYGRTNTVAYFNFFSRRTPLYGPSVQVPAGTKPRFS